MLRNRQESITYLIRVSLKPVLLILDSDALFRLQ